MCIMAKFVKEVEAAQFLPAADEKQFNEIVIDGASTIVHAGDFVEYENGVAVEVWSESKFKAKHKELMDDVFVAADETVSEEKPKGKKK